MFRETKQVVHEGSVVYDAEVKQGGDVVVWASYSELGNFGEVPVERYLNFSELETLYNAAKAQYVKILNR